MVSSGISVKFLWSPEAFLFDPAETKLGENISPFVQSHALHNKLQIKQKNVWVVLRMS